MPSKQEMEAWGKQAWAAARAGDAPALTVALEAGADPDKRNKMGRTLLMQAAISGCEACVNALEDKADSSRVDSFGNTALMLAASHGHDACVEALIPWSDMEASCRREGWTALARALLDGHVSTAAMLAKAGASLAGRDKRGRTLAMGIATDAAVSERRSTLAWLAQTDPYWAAGAEAESGRDFMMACAMARAFDCACLAIGLCDPTARDNEGNTALILAARNEPRMAKLLASSSRVSDSGADGMTALMWAAASGSMEALKPILACCVLDDIDVTSSQGVNAGAIARREGHDAAASAIEEARARMESQELRHAVVKNFHEGSGAQRV